MTATVGNSIEIANDPCETKSERTPATLLLPWATLLSSGRNAAARCLPRGVVWPSVEESGSSTRRRKERQEMTTLLLVPDPNSSATLHNSSHNSMYGVAPEALMEGSVRGLQRATAE